MNLQYIYIFDILALYINAVSNLSFASALLYNAGDRFSCLNARFVPISLPCLLHNVEEHEEVYGRGLVLFALIY